MNLKAIPGTRDILPSDAPIWQWVEGTARDLFERWGYREIRTPIFEDSRLFERGIGETTEIVEKEMYTLTTGGGSRLTLRPEATAPVVRAYLEHSLHKSRPFQKLYYIGPHFRHERPQAHRWRQFFQLGVEALGSKEPRLDAETVSLAHNFFGALGLEDLELRVNSIGDEQCRPAMRARLQEALADRLEELCENCQARYHRNVFRILDCKKESCRRVASGLPDLSTLLCNECRAHFDAVLAALEELGIRYEHDPKIVRGLDYYSRTVWEIDDRLLGAHNALGGGGRYDPLLVELEGPDVGGVGFALGTDRIVDSLRKRDRKPPQDGPGIDVYIVSVEDDARRHAFLLQDRLRREGVSADSDYEGRSVKAQMRLAHRLGARWVAVIGPDELSRGIIRLKSMDTGEEDEVSEKELKERALSRG